MSLFGCVGCMCPSRARCLGLRYYHGMRRNTNSCTGREIEPLLDELVATCTPVLRRATGLEFPLYRIGSHILPSLGTSSKPPSHTGTLQVSDRTSLEFGGSGKRLCFNLRIRATQGTPKRKNFSRRALSCTSTRTHLEGHRSVELRNLPFKPCPRKPRAGVSGDLWRLPIGTDVVPLIYFLFSNV